ncbi:hypothetical protein [Mycolicibacterium aubagnense]|uniref:Uncharacterized protein n=1 Tax=Mycolicibacterium aubagnense TaxID=319707 RepID=A0ABN5Z4B3_9MYCO|nr:hypothetical protein [Mycolicibacterium aubagnense]TLH64268.1 hypothetical protein C1S80_12715 [Mycolicibacterium aubagnense]BBX87914.1 hypothetical protein MAUB_57870 [Mycolicibacterium aubagnense]
MTLSSDTIIGFGGDGLPDTDWLGCHERATREQGDVARADAFSWMIAQFNRHVVLVQDAVDEVDPDIFPRQSVRVGSYRLFEFAVAREEMRTARVAQRQCAGEIRAGNEKAAVARRDSGPTYEEAAKEEIHACMSNFLCVTAFADEFHAPDPLRRWTDTVPEQCPDELRNFIDAYLDTLRSISALPAHDEALRSYLRSLRDVYDGPDAHFDAAAGRAHAWRVLMYDARMSDTRKPLD